MYTSYTNINNALYTANGHQGIAYEEEKIIPRKYRLYIAGVCAAAVPEIGECASNVSTSSRTTAATQESQEASREETAVEGTTVAESVTDTIESVEESQVEASRSIRIYGPVTRVEDGRLLIGDQSSMNSSGEITLNISSDATYILDTVTGLPIKAEDIRDGETIYVYVGPAMTMNLPPMTNVEVIFASIPADAEVPDLVEVKSTITDTATPESVLAAVDGTECAPAPDCDIFPYLTRNIVTPNDLIQGRKYVVWSDDDSAVVKITVFAEWIQI